MRQENKDIEGMVVQIVMCESGGRPDAVGDNGKAYGLTQYHSQTFYLHAKRAGLANANWKNNQHQLTLLRWCLTEGNCGKEWTCWRRLFSY